MMAAALTAAMTLGELLGATAGPHAGRRVCDLVLDSRQVTPGAAFVAVAGARSHGLAFAADALARGAEIVLYEPDAAHAAPEPSLPVPGLKSRLGELAQTFYARDAALPELTGITGTNGKTTVAYLIAQAFGRLGSRCGYLGTLGYGVHPELVEHALTTPDCFTLHRELAGLGAGRAAVEVSSHALAQDRIAGLTFERAVFTNLTRDHLDEHGDLEAYGRAKARLFVRPGLRHAVLNFDDPFAASLPRTLAPGAAPLGTSLAAAPDAALHGRLYSRGLDGLRVDVGGRFGDGSIDSRLVGDFNASNLLLALGVLVSADTPLERACAALSAANAPPGRMERFGGTRGRPFVIVDYAHTPDALARVLAVLRAAAPAPARIWCVFGCGGERDAGKRELMGRAAAHGADRIVLTDDNPRREDPAAIVADIRGGVGALTGVEVEHDRGAAIERAVRAAGAGDVVLVAGKGHERSQQIGAERRPFDDRVAAAEALKGAT